jgi:diguanylate cyclase (GGDEF)-like protein/PAS domain S-box-containing protein
MKLMCALPMEESMGASMRDRTELLEATLDSLPEGVALLDEESNLVFWNQAAEAITGHSGLDRIGRPAPETLKPLLERFAPPGNTTPDADSQPACGCLVHAQHKLGHDVPAMVRIMALRDGLGGRIGTAVVFHPAESLDALPHGQSSEGEGVEVSQADLKDRLESEFEDFTRGGETFGVLWITVDQAHDLRKTHGVNACGTMIEKVEQVLARGLRPTEKLGRWGDDEFLVISHERTTEMLASHAQALAGLARTADFRWWGDRVSITVSIGTAQADEAGTLRDLLATAKAAMLSSFHAGGNQITSAPGGQACSPS